MTQHVNVPAWEEGAFLFHREIGRSGKVVNVVVRKYLW